jgi:putative glutamine amidotransferase
VKRIGITCGHDQPGPMITQHDTYIRAITAAGGTAVLLPPVPPEHVLDHLEMVGGVMLGGGGDLHGHWFGQPLHPLAREVDPERDAYEIALVKQAAEDKKPVLGICRGMQIVNCALGGDLWQDLSLMPVTQEINHFPKAPLWYGAHMVRIKEGSRLSQLCGGAELWVNSTHHQAVHRLGEGLVSVGVSEDGVIEAIEGQGDAFLLAVQWHPEKMTERSPQMQRLFHALIRACA